MIHAAYITGQRLSDLLSVQCNEIQDEGRWVVTQHETGRVCYMRFSIEAMQYAGELGERQLFLPWPYSIETFRKRFRKLVNAADISPGTFKWIRRAAGSFFEKANTGGGHRLLGNTREIFDKSYHDVSVTSDAFQAPPLGI